MSTGRGRDAAPDDARPSTGGTDSDGHAKGLGDAGQDGFAGFMTALGVVASYESAPNTYRDLGITPLALQLGLPEDRLGGHWCSRCCGLWWGVMLETQCPRCGNRGG